MPGQDDRQPQPERPPRQVRDLPGYIVQQDLKCKLISPQGCTEEEPDPAAGALFVPVTGIAGGLVFGSYTLDIQRADDPPIPGIVLYPGGGASGTTPVFPAGELGRINTTMLSDGAYTVTLRVHPAGPGPSKSDTSDFNLLKVTVYINRIANIPAVSMAPVPYKPQPFRPGRRAAFRRGTGGGRRRGGHQRCRIHLRMHQSKDQ